MPEFPHSPPPFCRPPGQPSAPPEAGREVASQHTQSPPPGVTGGLQHPWSPVSPEGSADLLPAREKRKRKWSQSHSPEGERPGLPQREEPAWAPSFPPRMLTFDSWRPLVPEATPRGQRGARGGFRNRAPGLRRSPLWPATLYLSQGSRGILFGPFSTTSLRLTLFTAVRKQLL